MLQISFQHHDGENGELIIVANSYDGVVAMLLVQGEGC
jgi:hypothetical protein